MPLHTSQTTASCKYNVYVHWAPEICVARCTVTLALLPAWNRARNTSEVCQEEQTLLLRTGSTPGELEGTEGQVGPSGHSWIVNRVAEGDFSLYFDGNIEWSLDFKGTSAVKGSQGIGWVTFESSEHDVHGTAHPQFMGDVTSKGAEGITVCSYDSHKHRGKPTRPTCVQLRKTRSVITYKRGRE